MPTDVVTPDVVLPPSVERQLAAGAVLAVSISGGKDSQAMLNALIALHKTRGWRGEIFAIHADLGRIEWPQTAGHVERIASEAGVRLVVVRRADGRGMIEHWRARAERLKARGKRPRPWSDAKNRFCTSDLKRDPIDSYLRRYSRVVCAVGIRAQESSARARQPEWRVRSRIDNSQRTALDWHPILHWRLPDVLRACGTSFIELRDRQALYRNGNVQAALDGWPMHPAYVFGNERLSCQFCVLACQSDLRNGARQRPEILAELVAMEVEYGFQFQAGRSLASLAE